MLSSPPSGPIIKKEPSFIGPEKIVGPDPTDFDTFCTVPDDDLNDNVVAEGEQLCNLIVETPKRQLPNIPEDIIPTTNTAISDVIRTGTSATQSATSDQSILMEMDFLRAEKISLQTRIKSLEEQVYIYNVNYFVFNQKLK